ncbi:MAG: protein translocase subunit SecD [Anaerolineales bacterium]|jgi:preprotein translocase subunit SecD
MGQRYWRWLIVIAILLALDLWINWPGTSSIQVGSWSQNVTLREGLDLQGGLEVLLEAALPANQAVPASSMDAVRTVIEDRVNGLGVAEPVVQVSGSRRILVELPGYENPQDAVALIKQTGLLEFVDADSTPLVEGTIVQTDYGRTGSGSATPSPQPSPSLSSATPEATPVAATAAAAPTPTGPVYHTVMTGADLSSVNAGANQLGQPVVNFVLDSAGTKIFSDYTTTHVGQYLAIVLDDKVISSPVVQTAITNGQGQISGNFTVDSANALAIQLRYGALPIPLQVAQIETVGPSLGQDSLRRSLVAGAVGMSVVVLFMILYYRLPGILADLALALYAMTALSIFRLVPVTFTLPGIAGFVLSVGMAVDANVLIFERLKEELRSGKPLRVAVDAGFSRAWPSIRDSNISTIITCLILYWFGGAFGASLVKGFALTLAIGVLVSMFTAIIVTRTFLHVVLDRMDFSRRHSWFGI